MFPAVTTVFLSKFQDFYPGEKLVKCFECPRCGHEFLHRREIPLLVKAQSHMRRVHVIELPEERLREKVEKF